MTDQIFLDFSINKLEQLTERIRECLARLTYEQVWARGTENQNAIGNLVLHLSGNVRQWIISGVGGAPDNRVRDREFAARGDIPVPELLKRLEGTVSEAVAVLRAVKPERLAATIKPQSYELTVLEAIYHVVEHFSQHAGQIMYATKLVTGGDLGFYKHLTAGESHAEKVP